MGKDLENQYVLGFLFDKEGIQVALVLKNRPKWQAGRMNGIGGHIKEDESAYRAMVREFKEETGVEVETWECFARMVGSDWNVDCFKAFSDECIANVKTMTDEKVDVVPVVNVAENLNPKAVISNIPWLLRLALDKQVKHVNIGYR